MKTRILSLILCLALCLGAVSILGACQKKDDEKKKPDALVIMTEELDGLFNPFYSTSANDATIVGMTQISMITTGYKNGEVVEAYGDDEATVVKDYIKTYDSSANKTTYTFVIKNGIKFSDGKPLTMNDILFNMYVYLDPAYAGSSTMYSVDIVGLQQYRTQMDTSGSNDTSSIIAQTAQSRAQNRINELINAYNQALKEYKADSLSAEEFESFLKTWKITDGYKAAVTNDYSEVDQSYLIADYRKISEMFREELESDANGALENFTGDEYKKYTQKTGFEFDEISAFMALEGYVSIEYEKDENNRNDLNNIKKISLNYSDGNAKTLEEAINFVHKDKMEGSFTLVLTGYQTASNILTDFTSKATEVILKENLKDGELAYPNISGIVSLGHTSDVTEVKTDEATYKVAHEHNEDGTVKNTEEYDVLQITINDIDPKAIWSFAFAVAPQHYYAKGYEVDIVNNKFGVEWASYEFMTNVIQAPEVTKVPMGAGAYMATDSNNSDTPNGNSFYSNNVVYFKANNNFLLGQPKTEKIRYQVVSSSNALNALSSGSVHLVSPQLTDDNMSKIESLKSSGVKSMYTDQLGYGYIGINAGKIPDINIRKAIMTAMDTSLSLDYYRAGTASRIYWPMSKVSWAYPTGDAANDNGHSYPAINFNEETAKAQIREYMSAANVQAGSSSLKITFTVAGSNITEHPVYSVFLNAASILNDLGWDIEVIADTQALTKLATGSLSVWAAAWGSTVDPDLYQVYHKNSTATSTLAWGYREILNNPAKYPTENSIINDLSDLIDEARETDDRTERSAIYEDAMKLILDLAVELPVYQRSVLYAYDSTVIDESTLPNEINPYTSPLERIWEIELVG